MRDALVKVALLEVRIEVNLVHLINLLTALADTVLLASDGGRVDRHGLRGVHGSRPHQW